MTVEAQIVVMQFEDGGRGHELLEAGIVEEIDSSSRPQKEHLAFTSIKPILYLTSTVIIFCLVLNHQVYDNLQKAPIGN